MSRYILPLFLAACLGMPLPAMAADKLALPALPALDRPEQVQLPIGEKPMLLHLFASWCGICGLEAPALVEYAKLLPLPMYGIAYKDIPADTARWLQRHGSPYEMVLSDQNGLLGDLADVTGTPESLLIDKKGRVVWHYAGAIPPELFVRELLPLAKKLANE